MNSLRPTHVTSQNWTNPVDLVGPVGFKEWIGFTRTRASTDSLRPPPVHPPSLTIQKFVDGVSRKALSFKPHRLCIFLKFNTMSRSGQPPNLKIECVDRWGYAYGRQFSYLALVYIC
ncbi:hypothetical protein FNV43_RR00069 [Rhamnella rubrinervis]|uniref:Uncharacterized protein n=1 Tax=Rhamnella rubrinervis TaxID=2594499 RepID=A0A8K0HME1_9ROSA|nr:hypothetical protein FNV43_RR00069 [Rhamnella rubrinervis]